MKTIVWMESYLAQAEQLIFNGQVHEGLHMLNTLLFEEPGYANLHNYLGWAYLYHAHDEAKAELHLKMAIRFAAEYAPPYLHLGNLCNRRGRYSEAIKYFRRGLTKPEANRASLLEGMAEAYELRSEYRHAIRAYKEAAGASVLDFEVDRMLKGAKRCRRKRLALFFSF